MRDGNDYPLPYLKEGILSLKSVGCDYIVIPCNSAHYWFDDLNELGIPILHIVDSVADALTDINVTNTTIGIMGTQATIELGLYQYRLNKLGWDCIVPTKDEMDTKVQPAIDLIKGGKIHESQPLLVDVIHTLIDRGAKAVVLGCTELPLAIKILNEEGIPIVNSIDSLVKSVINRI
jgi:aspartate racemase